MAEENILPGPDFKSGIEFSKLVENEPLLGHYEGEPVAMVRQCGDVFAIAATCTHYGGPIAEGIVGLKSGGIRTLCAA